MKLQKLFLYITLCNDYKPKVKNAGFHILLVSNFTCIRLQDPTKNVSINFFFNAFYLTCNHYHSRKLQFQVANETHVNLYVYEIQ